MKQVINITLGGIVFAIEQESYEKLAQYFEQIKSNLSESDDAKEIIGDIENAVAEKFIARNRSEKIAVTISDVEEVIVEMGSPADFGEGKESDKTESETKTVVEGEETKRRLYRDSDNSIIAGVSSGLANYFDVDPVIVRLIFVISVFFNGLGILAYIILWLVVPVASTTADKYAMRGERVTLKDISERVKKNIEQIEKADYSATKGLWSKLRLFLEKLFQALGMVVDFFIVLARYVVGIALVIGGALGIAGMVSVYSVILLSQKVFFPQEVQLALETMQGSSLGIVAMVSSFIMMATLFIVLIVAGASLLAKRNFLTVQKLVILLVVWIVATVVAGTTSALQLESVIQKIGEDRGRDYGSRLEIKRGNDTMYYEGGYGEYRYRDTSDLPVDMFPNTSEIQVQ